jgi:hypothetical protein
MKMLLITIINIIIFKALYFLYNLNIFLINGSGASSDKNIEKWAIGFLFLGIIHILLIFIIIRSEKFKIALSILMAILYVYFYFSKW